VACGCFGLGSLTNNRDDSIGGEFEKVYLAKTGDKRDTRFYHLCTIGDISRTSTGHVEVYLQAFGGV
jgi:hypothetical protein